ncbi:MAG TPA: hypothetical protein VLG44_00360 [Chlamydiales bacterium]|nr:hypothetical protein [Chlamydiales bacterium]
MDRFKIICFFLLLVSGLHATFVDNFSKPSIIHTGLLIPDTSVVNLRGGVVADFLIKKKLHANTFPGKTHSFWISSIATMGSVTMNIKERFEISGYFGSGFTDLHFDYGDIHYFGKKHGQFFWVLDSKLIIFEREGLCFGIDGKILGQSSSMLFSPSIATHYSFFEWQVAAGLSQQFSYFTPYIGVTFTNLHVHLKPFPLLHRSIFKLRHREQYGIVFGFTLSSGNYVSFDVEGRLINEAGFYTSFDLRF